MEKISTRVAIVVSLLFLSGFGAVFLIFISQPRRPKIHVYNPVVDLGIINEKAEPKHIQFKIENRGKAPLQLTRVEGSCPCLKLRLDLHRLLPDKQATLTATVSPAKNAGPWSDTVLLYSNDPDKNITKLSIKAYVEPICTVVPSSLIVENLRRGEPHKTELKIVGPRNDTSFKVLGLSSTSTAINLLQINRADIIQELGRSIWQAFISVNPRGLESWHDNIVILTSLKNQPEIRVPVSVYEVPDVKVSPKLVSLRRTRQNPRPTAEVQICAGNIQEPLRIKDINCPDWLEVSTEDMVGCNGRLVRLRASVKPSRKRERLMRGRIAITFEKNDTSLSIPVLLWDQPPG